MSGRRRQARRYSLPRPLVGGVGALSATGAAFAAGGPVAAVIAAAYAALAVRAWLRAGTDRRATAARTAAIDAVGTLAADLRAGLPPAVALAEALPALRTSGEAAVARAAALVDAGVQVADRLGAPLAVLLDRIDADLRATERCRSTVSAQTAGARATAWLLAALPLGGVGLGYVMGGHPLRVLLHTPLGAGCALLALLLQCAGLAWTARLCRSAVEEPA